MTSPDDDDHPQFNAGSGKPRKKRYDIKRLRAMAQHLIQRWRNLGENLKLYRRCGLEPYFMKYEDWLADPDGELESFRVAVRRCADCDLHKKADMSFGGGPSTVHKVHSSDISTFVENSDEVIALFEAARFPTFDQVVRDFARCTPGAPGCNVQREWWTPGRFVPWDPQNWTSSGGGKASKKQITGRST